MLASPWSTFKYKFRTTKKLRFTGFRQEVIGGRGMPYRRPGLPAGTDMLLTGIYRHVEAGIRLCGSDPSAIQAKTGSGSWRTLEIRVALQKINQCLGGFCMRNRMFGTVSRDVAKHTGLRPEDLRNSRSEDRRQDGGVTTRIRCGAARRGSRARP